MLAKVVLMCLAVWVVSAARTRYDGYKILEITLSNVEQVEHLKALERRGHVEVLTTLHLGSPGHILVGPTSLGPVRLSLLASNIKMAVHVDNLQVDIEREQRRLDARYRKDPYAFDINDFNTLESVYAQLPQWVSACPSGLTCEVQDIGKSYLGVEMKVFKIAKTGATNKGVWFESVIHASEWLSIATGLKFINHMITKYTSDPDVKSMVDNHDWYFIVIANPDGYKYSFEHSRLWRRNRRPTSEFCVGVDLNRNFDVFHGKEGVSPECTDNYPGETPESEIETQNIVTKAKTLLAAQDFDAWMAVHTYGKMFMYPYSHTVGHNGSECVLTPDDDDLHRVAEAAVSAMEDIMGEPSTWKNGTICNVIYPATGDEVNYMYMKQSVKYAWAIELRGNNLIVNPSEIGKSFTELWSGVKAMLKEIKSIEG